MAQLPVNFDAASVAPQQALDAVPAGWYNMQITNSEMKPTKSNDGAFLQLEHTILDAPYAGRKVFNNLNLQNANPTAQEIAYATLSAICHAVGVIQVADSSVLHGKPMLVKVKVEAATAQNEARNAVTGYKAAENAAATPAWTGQPANTVPEAAAAPWQAPVGQMPNPNPTFNAIAPAPAPVAAPAPVVAPAPVANTVKTMTDLAKGVTYEAYVESKWSDKQMIDAGLLVVTEENEPAWSNTAPTQPSAPPAAPAPVAAPVATAAAPAGIKPPWEQ